MPRAKIDRAAGRGARHGARSGERVAVIMLKDRAEYRDWINELTEWARMPASMLIDHPLAEKSEQLGFRPPPPR
jgi:hypothetical protein